MRKITVILILLLFAGMTGFSQKKSGTIYSEHDAIETTNKLWKAFADGDVELYLSCMADPISHSTNGAVYKKMTHEQMTKNLKYWSENYSQLKVKTVKPNFPDALEYKDHGVYVQDWLLLTGVHNESGIVLNLPIHNLYAFNDEGKVKMLVNYFDKEVFETIEKSQEKTTNGKIFDNHPYIAKVRKAMNAFRAKDAEAWGAHFSPKCGFYSSTQEWGEKDSSLEEMKAYFTKYFFQDGMKFKVEETGYPDCVYYAKNDMYVVYSWWIMTVLKNGEKTKFGFMLSDNFNKDGEIVQQITYISSNHLDKFY